MGRDGETVKDGRNNPQDYPLDIEYAQKAGRSRSPGEFDPLPAWLADALAKVYFLKESQGK